MMTPAGGRSGHGGPVRVVAVVVSWGDEPWLERSVEALLASTGIDLEVVVVDNGCTDGAVDRLAAAGTVTIAGDGTNAGFAGGCNVGVAASRPSDLVALINGDAIVAPDALAELAAAVADETVGIATASVRLADRPELLNSGGNEVHFLGLSWCGRFEEPASDHTEIKEVASASGSSLAVRRELWDELGGFPEEYVAYYEDAEMSLRCRQRGLRVIFVPTAVVEHRYEFGRNASKLYLAERNRLTFFLTGWERRTIAGLAPVLIATELAMFAIAVLQGWSGAKARGWWWLLANRRWVKARRALLQSQRTVGDAELADLWVTRLEFTPFPVPRILRPLDRVLEAYWNAILRALD